jgi:RNA polymerase sigma-B factor
MSSFEEQRDATRRLFVELGGHAMGADDRAHARDQLVELHLPLVHHLARRYRDRGEPLDDLIQVGTIGLINAVDRFETGRGVEFSTYATPTIIGEIKRHFRDKGWAIRVPRRLQELRITLAQATAELSQTNGRPPTISELAEHVGVGDDEVLEGLESAGAYSTLSLDAPDQSGSEASSMGGSIGIDDEGLAGVEHREALRPLLSKLPPREREILLLRFFGELTQSQIADRVGISQMHVSRLLAKTLTHMRGELLDE